VERTLSSGFTFTLKFIFPVLWIGGFGYGTLQLFTHPGEVTYNGVRGGAPPDAKWLFLLMWVLGAATLGWLTARLKRVRIDNDGLLVSNYREEVRVPFAAVTKVTQNRWVNARPITVEFRHETPLGRRATFIPAGRGRFAFWREDEIVAELRRRAGLAIGSAPDSRVRPGR